MSDTRPELKSAWRAGHLRCYSMSLHKLKDKDIIDYIDKRRAAGDKISDIYREAMRNMMEKENAVE